MVEQIHANVVAINLGKCIYYARCERYTIPSVHWDALDLEVKRSYIERAQGVLEALRPMSTAVEKFDAVSRSVDLVQHMLDTATALNRATYATGLRRPDKVVGSIEPKEAS